MSPVLTKIWLFQGTRLSKGNITQHHNSEREHYITSQFAERTLHNITIRRENITQHHQLKHKYENEKQNTTSKQFQIPI